MHFATQGLLAGETALFAKKKAEPALLLTSPVVNKANEEHNGLLTAFEGSSDGAEALSRLARAFFYAGTRSLSLIGR
jgi:hypothetical protein